MKTTSRYKIPYIEGPDKVKELPALTKAIAEALEAGLLSGDLRGAPGERGLPGVNAVPADAAVAAYIGATGSATNTAVAAAATAAATKANVRMFTPRQFGAKGNGLTDDTAGVQAALDAARDAGGGTVVFEHGTYRVTAELNVYSNTTIDLDWSTIRRDHAGYLFLAGDRGASYTAYNGMHDISVKNGTLDHNAASQPGRGSIWCMSHCKNIFFEAVTFKDATSHGIELNASFNVHVTRCNFMGYRGTDTYVESIQLDLAMAGGFSAYGAYDGTYSEHIIVEGCVFTSSAAYPPSPRGIGSHGSRSGAAPRDITIKACRFINLPSLAIRPYDWHQVTVEGCYCTGDGGFLLANTIIVGNGTTDNTKTVAGVQTGKSLDVAGLTVKGNQHRGAGPSVYVKGEATGRHLGVVIKENRFDNNYSGDHCIQLDQVDGVGITDNTIYRAGGNGIFTPPGGAALNLSIIGNTIDGTQNNGIAIQAATGVTLVGNETKNCGRATASTFNHVRLTGVVGRVTITAHIAVPGSAATPAVGLYANNTVTRMSRSACDWGGFGVTDSSVAPLVAAERA